MGSNTKFPSVARDNYRYKLESVARQLRRTLRRGWRKLRRVKPPQNRARIAFEPNPRNADPVAPVRLFAVMGTWMEGDVVASTVANAFRQGCERVYLVDNDSPDDTVAEATRAGARLARRFATENYDERLRLRLMNDVVHSVSTEEADEHLWWLFLDADEFPHGPRGFTVAEYLATLDRRFRVVGARFFNHYPTSQPFYVSGTHPLDTQPLCEEIAHPFCPQRHRKHPLFRVDRDGVRIDAGIGFHRLCAGGGTPLLEPEGGLIEHHFPFRSYEQSRARLEALCGTGRARTHDVHQHILTRFRSLEAVYAQRWDEVENFVEDRPRFGVHLQPWTELVEPADVEVARWYGTDPIRDRRLSLGGEAADPFAAQPVILSPSQ